MRILSLNKVAGNRVNISNETNQSVIGANILVLARRKSRRLSQRLATTQRLCRRSFALRKREKRHETVVAFHSSAKSLCCVGITCSTDRDVEPLKLIGLFIFGKGHWTTGSFAILFAYAGSLLVVERLFKIVKPKLLSLH
jgi:hypothetical protein